MVVEVSLTGGSCKMPEWTPSSSVAPIESGRPFAFGTSDGDMHVKFWPARTL